MMKKQDENNLCQIKTSDLRPVCYACEVYHLGVKEEKKMDPSN